jgi:hypothetical protein
VRSLVARWLWCWKKRGGGIQRWRGSADAERLGEPLQRIGLVRSEEPPQSGRTAAQSRNRQVAEWVRQGLA